MDENSPERFEQHGRFGRKPRRMSGMAASLLRAKTYQDTRVTLTQSETNRKNLK